MSPESINIIGLVVVILLMMVGVPVAIAFGGIAFIISVILWGLDSTLHLFSIRTYGVMSNYPMVCVPLFVFMGSLLEKAGVAERLFDVVYIAFGKVKAGLAITVILISIIFGACTGIAGAAVVTIGLIAMPTMLKRGYHKELISGCICSGGGLGVIIPPSIVFILYGATAGVSISKMFAGGIIPGCILGGAYIIYIFLRYNYFQPSLAPSIPPEERKEVTGKKLAQLFLLSFFPPLFLILAVLLSIFLGWAAPTEAASLGAVGSLIVCAVYSRLSFDFIKGAAYTTLRITAMIMFIVLGANLFCGVFLKAGTGSLIGKTIMGLNLSPIMAVYLMLLLIFIAGCFMDWIGILYILIPIFNPIVKTLGIDPIWFGMLFCISLQLSYMTPPFAYCIFYFKGIAPPEITVKDMYVGAYPFVICQIIVLFLLVYFPKLVTFLPDLIH